MEMGKERKLAAGSWLVSECCEVVLPWLVVVLCRDRVDWRSLRHGVLARQSSSECEVEGKGTILKRHVLTMLLLPRQDSGTKNQTKER